MGAAREKLEALTDAVEGVVNALEEVIIECDKTICDYRTKLEAASNQIAVLREALRRYVTPNGYCRVCAGTGCGFCYGSGHIDLPTDIFSD